MAEEPRYAGLALAQDPISGQKHSRYFLVPRTAEDLVLRSRLIAESARNYYTFPPLIKEIGTDCLFALSIVAAEMDRKGSTGYSDRVARYLAYCRDNDLAMAVAQTDVKGDRGRRPSEQADPDLYVRVVEEREDGIVVRGAKAHTTNAVFANEILVIPTRAMAAADSDYAVAFAVPANAEGVHLLASPRGSSTPSTFDHPISARGKMVESLTVFDDVFVPWDRVFMYREWEFAGPLAKTFVEFHRFTAISYKAPLLDLLVGMASLVAEANGIQRAGHVRDKLARLVMYSAQVKGLTLAAAHACTLKEGIAVPDPIYTNAAKYFFANGYHEAVRDVQDIAGGLVVTAPDEADWAVPETRKYMEKYLAGSSAMSAEERLRLINLVRDVTASSLGGYLEVLAIHAEGSLEAQKITVLQDFDFDVARRYAANLSGISSQEMGQS
jgi:4-hydroxybutyryl-CoA dehydratase/vinylacetyl-CoA-Delta-isomerase